NLVAAECLFSRDTPEVASEAPRVRPSLASHGLGTTGTALCRGSLVGVLFEEVQLDLDAARVEEEELSQADLVDVVRVGLDAEGAQAFEHVVEAGSIECHVIHHAAAGLAGRHRYAHAIEIAGVAHALADMDARH